MMPPLKKQKNIISANTSMKKLIYISALALLFVACSRKGHKKDAGKKEERVEIVPFYQNHIEISDLHKLDTNLILVEPEEYMDLPTRKKFIDCIWMMVKNPNSKVYFDSPKYTKPVTYKEIMERWTQCDS